MKEHAKHACARKGTTMALRKIAASALGAVLVGTAAAASLTAGAFAAVSPGQVLISDTQGVIWSYDLGTDELSHFANVTRSNYDIQYTGPRTVLIGNNDGFVSELNLATQDETTLWDGLEGSRGLAVSPRRGGTYYIAEANAGAISVVAPGSTEPATLIDGLVLLENVAVDKQGIVYYTAGTQLGRFDPSADPVVGETVAALPDDVAQLNGFVLSRNGRTAYVSSISGKGVYEVDLNTGDYTEAYAAQALPGSAEDVALAPNGDLYIIYNGEQGGLYRIPSGSEAIEVVYLNDGTLYDPVDILLTPFRGF